MPFYKKTDTDLLVAPTFVHGPTFTLDAELHETYTYPVDGWYWFDNLDAALTGIVAISTGRVSARQARLALLNHGLLDTVNTTIAAMPDNAAKIEWEYATEISRESPLVAALASILVLTPAEVDALFLEAANL